MKLLNLARGFPGHPLHRPLTDVAVGASTAATVLAELGAAWLGGSIGFLRGMRVLNLVDEPAKRALIPGQAATEQAEGA